MQKMLAAAPVAPEQLDHDLNELRAELYALEESLNGHQTRAEIGDYDIHRVGNWLWHAMGGVSESTYGPTPEHRKSLKYAADAFAPIKARLNAIIAADIHALRKRLMEADAPLGRRQLIGSQ